MSQPEIPEPGHSLSPGDHLGPYEIVRLLGAGGMGEVYRARDARLRRDVAVKVLHPYLAMTPEHVERLAREARAAGSLSHPNIVAVFDVGTEGPVSYVVSELLEGESLRSRLNRGPLPYRKALEYGIQIAQGLGAAHEKGLWHRDVKPGNAFITRDGHLKLLDFGLVKLREKTGVSSHDSTADDTQPGGIHGTLGYMAPEQMLGEAVDHRTDIFALGAVLYEMLAGVPAFRRRSAIETTRAVLNEEPPDLLERNSSLPPAAAAVVRRCLEKNKDERFQSARDLAFHLQQLHDMATVRSSEATERRWRGWPAVLPLLGLVTVGTLTWLVWQTYRPSPPHFEQLTFRRARIGGARFAGDGQEVIYSEAREREMRPGEQPGGEALDMWSLNGIVNPQSRLLGYKGSDILATRAGELLSVERHFLVGERFVGALAIAPIGQGRPRPLGLDVEDADWDASGRLAIVRAPSAGHDTTLESPPGHVLHSTPGSIRFPRFSRDGRRIAFLEDSSGLGLGGTVAIVDVNGKSEKATELTDNWESAKGLAWSAKGDEVWFTAGDSRTNRALRAVNLKRRERLVLPAAASWTLWDITPHGRILLTRDEERSAVVGLPPGQVTERDLSWFDTSGLADLSEDGRTLLFDDRSSVFTRETDGSPPVDLGLKGGAADDLSKDGSVLATVDSSRQLVFLPVGGGQTRLPAHGMASYRGAMWLPDGRRILFNARTPTSKNLRSYIQDLDGGPPRPLTPENTWATSISPDGQWAAAIHSDARTKDTKTAPRAAIELWPIAGGEVKPLQTALQGERPAAWSGDGRRLWVFRRGEMPARVFELDLATGRRSLWKTLSPADANGVYSIINLKITPDGRVYFYSYHRVLSQLYAATGLN